MSERVVVYDGAMGTNIQLPQPYPGRLLGQGELQRSTGAEPSRHHSRHSRRLSSALGAMWSRPTPSAEPAWCWLNLDLPTGSHEINVAAAKLAREVAQQFSTKDRPRFVAGSMGPTTKLPSLGHISFDEMVAAYAEQALALIEGGVDVLLVETAQDMLQAKIATVGVFDAWQSRQARAGQVQVTLQETGTMLLGTEIGAALTALETFDVDVIGLNCATGPAEMNDAVRYLGLNSTKHDFRAAECRASAERRRARRLQAHAAGTGAATTSISSPSTACASSADVAAPSPST